MFFVQNYCCNRIYFFNTDPGDILTSADSLLKYNKSWQIECLWAFTLI